MSLWSDYEIEAQFAKDYPFGIPNKYWHSKNGDIPVSEMTEQHIRNCMKMVGEDDVWYTYFQKELDKRNGG